MGKAMPRFCASPRSSATRSGWPAFSHAAIAIVKLMTVGSRPASSMARSVSIARA